MTIAGSADPFKEWERGRLARIWLDGGREVAPALRDGVETRKPAAERRAY